VLRKTFTAATLLITVGAGAVAGTRPAAAATTLGPLTAPSCATPHPGAMHCLARYRVAHNVRADAPPGLTPADIADAYNLGGAPAPSTAVAIVDAYDDPNAEADLAVYRQQYGLPACTTANGCFTKVDQQGDASPLPDPDPGWATEISLDLDAVSAACPSCHILLVEADSADTPSLGAAEDTAARLGATVVSNSYGTDEYPQMNADKAHWQHPGTSIVASSGDFGFTTASFPAVLGSSIAIGGTTLTRAPDTTRGWTESAWAGAGSGCSAYIGKPSWQHDKHCLNRTVADISAVADPDTGLAVYDTFEADGWAVFGGTSLAAPLISAMIARSGRVIPNAQRIYTHANALYDPVGGRNGFCGGDYLCTGKRGYDAPTGMGSPDGVAAL
jgi:subtilase family serine protease